jgi:hypothetical protein
MTVELIFSLKFPAVTSDHCQQHYNPDCKRVVGVLEKVVHGVYRLARRGTNQRGDGRNHNQWPHMPGELVQRSLLSGNRSNEPWPGTHPLLMKRIC